MQNLIKTGAIVSLKSGSPAMTVCSVKDTIVECTYFNTDTQSCSVVKMPMVLLQIIRPADEDLKIGQPVPLSPVGMYIAFNSEEERNRFIAEIENNSFLSGMVSETQH